jgi:hypothetical protein
MNQIGDIIKVFPNYANADPIYCKVIKFTNKRIGVRPLRVIGDSNWNGQRYIKKQLDFNDYKEDRLKYVKLEYNEPYEGDGEYTTEFYD